MQLIHGMTVRLWNKTQQTDNQGDPVFDGANAPVWEWSYVDVDNVLVGEPSPQERDSELNFTGRMIEYMLGIPKGDEHNWENQIVEFFGHKFLTIGIPVIGIEENVPGPWHKKVKCVRYE